MQEGELGSVEVWPLMNIFVGVGGFFPWVVLFSFLHLGSSGPTLISAFNE